MTENNFNSEASNTSGNEHPENTGNKPKGSRGLIYAILIVALAGTWGYLLWDKAQHNQKEQQLTQQVATTDSSRAELEQEYEAANSQIDQLTSQNTHMDSLVKSKDKELGNLRGRIQSILNDKNATQAQLDEARQLIAQLNATIEGYKEQIEKLEGEKIVLTGQRDSLKHSLDTATAQNQNLTKQVDLGSVLQASNIQITPLHVRGNGKEVVTTKAKRADMMRISFDLDANRISPSGSKDLYVCITAPDSTPLAVEALGSGKFTLADGTEKLYTAMKSVNYTTGQKLNVKIDWKQNSDFKPGTYKVEIYESGYLIGVGNVVMKKGGFL
jgi:predicted  nucleic acid-binding Zn-ribbon protein